MAGIDPNFNLDPNVLKRLQPNQPAGAIPTATTGGNLQSVQLNPTMTTIPSTPVPLAEAINGQQYVAQLQGGNPGQGPGPSQTVNRMWDQAGSLDRQQSASGVANSTINDILDPGNAYIQSARRAGLERTAARGGLNSSIGAGASQRAAIDAAMPIFQSAMGLTGQREAQDFQDIQNRANAAVELTGQRENRAFQGQQAGLDRIQGVNNALLGQELRERNAQMDYEITRQLQADAVSQQNWLADQSYTREFNGSLAAMPITNAFQMNRAILDYAMANPEVYSPEIISGLSNFFNGNMVSILQQYFPNMVADQGGA